VFDPGREPGRELLGDPSRDAMPETPETAESPWSTERMDETAPEAWAGAFVQGDGAGGGELDLAADDMERLLPALDGAPGPARRLSSARTRRMVSAIVDAAAASPHEMTAPRLLAAPAAPSAPPSPFDVTRSIIFEPPVERRPRIARRGVAMAAALVFASVGSAAAGVWIAMRERPAAAPPTAAAGGGERAPARGPRHPIAAGKAATDVEPGVPPAPAASPAAPVAGATDEADLPPDERGDDRGDDGDVARTPHRREHPRAPRERSRPQRQHRRDAEALPDIDRSLPDGDERAAAEEPEVAPELEPAPRLDPIEVAPPPNAPVEDIVAAANQQRKEKRWRRAEALYERVMRDHAGTDAAAIATVASASLHLDRLADPDGALRRFRQALRLRPDGPLAEEARWGLAETQRALGDKGAERSALRAFLAAHPRSVNAARARQRLAELGPEQ